MTYYRYKPNKAERENYARACREIEEKGLKLSKSNRGLSIYGENDGKFYRVSNHILPDYYEKNFDEEIICKNQRDVFAFWGVDL